MATVCEHGGVASLIGKVKLLVKNVRLGEAADGAVRAIASGHLDNRSHCFLMFKWSVGKRKNLKIEPSFGILEPFERQHIVLEIILDSVQKLILPNYFELLVETASKEQIEKCSSTIWDNRSLVEVRIPVELTFHDKPLDSNVEDDLVKDEKLNHHITVAEIVNGIGKLDIRNDRNKSEKYNEKFSPTYAIISVGFGEPRYKLSSQTNDKYRTENFSSKYIRSIMVVPVDFSENIPETMTSEAFVKSKFSENKTAVNRCNDDGIVESDSYLKLENAVKLDPVSNMDRETELLETIKLKEMLELFLEEEENFIYSSGKSTDNSENGSIEEIEGSVVGKNAAFKVGNGKQAAVIIGDKKNDDCSSDWTKSNTDTSSLETDMTEAEYECNSSRHVAVEEITVTTDDNEEDSEEITDTTENEDSEEITDTTENEDSEEDTDTTDTENSDSDESDCSGCVENMSNEKGSSDEDSTIYDFEYECLLEEECDDNGSEEKAEQQLKKKKSTTNASRHKKRSSSICSCCSDTE